MAYEETVNILDSRNSTSSNISADKIKTYVDEKDERMAAAHLDKAEKAYVNTISSTKVPIYGDL